MQSESGNAPFTELIGTLENSKQGVVVLCCSTRAAFLLKRKILQNLVNRAILDIEVISASELVAKISRSIGIESKVIGGLGREMLVSEILSGLKASIKEYANLDLKDYVKGISDTIGELIQAGVDKEDIGAEHHKSLKMRLLKSAFIIYRKKLADSGILDAKELPRKIFDANCAVRLKESLNSKSIMCYCIQEDKLALETSENLRNIGFEVRKIDPGPARSSLRADMHKLYARQGRQLAREVARKCKSLVIEHGCEYTDICVIVPPSSGKEKEVTLALEWAGIPCSDPVWEKLSDHPAASSLSSALELFASSNERLDAFLYCSSPYYGMEHFDREKPKSIRMLNNLSACTSNVSNAAMVESYLWRKSKLLYLSEWSNIKNWGRHFRPVKKDDSQMDEARADFYKWAALMKELSTKMNKRVSWTKHCDSLQAFFNEFYTGKTPISDEQSDPRSSSLEAKALTGIQQVIDKVRSANDLMINKEEQVDWREFASTIQQAFKEKRLMLRGSSTSGVGVGEPKDVVGLEFKHTIFYEASEDNFPKQWNTGWVLTETDRKSIAGLCDQSAESRNKQAKEHFLLAAGSASETLCFAIPSIGDAEKPVNASTWVFQLEDAHTAYSKAINVEYIKRRLPAPERRAACVTENERALTAIDESIFSISLPWGKEKLKQRNFESVERIKALCREKFDDEYKWSPSILNLYLRCGLSLVPRYLTGLRERDEYEELPSAITTGDFLHRIAEKVLLKIAVLRNQEFDSSLRTIVNLLEDELSYHNSEISGSMSEEVWQLYKGQYMRIMTRFAESELMHAQKDGSVFTSYITEKDFVTGGDCDKLALRDMQISFKVRVDRIDVTHDGKAAIFDYKSGSMPDKQMDVQLDFYSLLAARALGFTPIATAYFPLSVGKGSTRINISKGNYVDEYRTALGFKEYHKVNKSLLPHALSDVPDKLEKSSERIAEIIKSIRGGNLITTGPSSLDVCKHCIRDAICWKTSGNDQAED